LQAPGEVQNPGVRQIWVLADALECDLVELVETEWQTVDETFVPGDPADLVEWEVMDVDSDWKGNVTD
jgi:hypothetical protein